VVVVVVVVAKSGSSGQGRKGGLSVVHWEAQQSVSHGKNTAVFLNGSKESDLALRRRWGEEAVVWVLESASGTDERSREGEGAVV